MQPVRRRSVGDVAPQRSGPDPGDQRAGFYVLAVFVMESAAFTALSGGSFGQLATRLRVVRANGDPRPVALQLALSRIPGAAFIAAQARRYRNKFHLALR